MSDRKSSPQTRSAAGLLASVFRPELVVFAPAMALASLWHGLPGAAVTLACALPFALFARRPRPSRARPDPVPRDGATGLPLRSMALAAIDTALDAERESGKSTACLVLAIDEADQIADRHGRGAMAEVMRKTAERIAGTLRDEDIVVRLDGARFAIVLGPIRRADLETVIQIAARMQTAAEMPLSIDATSVYVSASVGFCLASRVPQRTGVALMAAAERALDEALRNGPGAIRAFSVEVQSSLSALAELREDVEAALEGGHIVPYFQPQISTDTGALSGFEALARWVHPERGLLPPAEFLAVIEQTGLSARLGEVILYHAFSALKSWDKAGLKVPTVAVNFSRDELRNPKLPEKLKWELDRFELAPERLVIEILESVVADTSNDVIVRNLAALARLGCGIDLDDFGTGHASIANIRRFDVDRIKIDRSFVARIDTDLDQQKMIGAILSMAERLGLATLAEGVETIGEHTTLAQLGCSHVQGFGIARPMPFEDTAEWMERHRNKLQATPRAGRRAV